MASGNFEKTLGSYGVKAQWSSTTDLEKNTSTVTVEVYVSYYSIDIGSRTCRCTVNNQTQEVTVAAIHHSGSNASQKVASFTFTVPHNQDGTKTCNLSASFLFNLTSASLGYIGWLDAGGTITLDTIPRAATLTATGGVIGGEAVLRWKPNSDEHTFQLTVGDFYDESFVPESTDEEICRISLLPEYTRYLEGTPLSANVTAVLQTLQNGKKIGESQADFTITMPPYSMPSVAVRECYRADASGNPAADGTYLYVEAECYISPYKKDSTETNTLKVYCAVNDVTVYEGVEPEANLQGVSLSTTQAYQVKIWAKDLTDQSAVSTVYIPTAAADFHLRQGGKGAAFGCYATKENAVQLAEGWTLYLGEKTLEEYIKSLL